MPLQGPHQHTNLHKIRHSATTVAVKLSEEGKSVLLNHVTGVYGPHPRAGIPVYLSVYT